MIQGKKILFLAHSNSIHSKHWIEYFIQCQWEVYVISFHPEKIAGANNTYLNVGKINVEGKNYKYLFKLPQIFYYIYKIKPDIINCHYLSSYGLLGYLSLYRNITHSLYGSDIFLTANENIIVKILTRHILRKCLLVFSVSEQMTNMLVQKYKVNPQKIITMQYGVNLNIFRCLNKTKNRKNIFFTNRSFTDNSNYEKILEIMNNLRERNINYNLLIVGTGPLKYDLMRMIEKMNLEENILIGDYIECDEMVSLLNESLIYMSIPDSDGAPLSVFEAAACGAYPVLSDIQANREWLDKGLQGLSIDVNDIPRAAESIIDLLMKIDSIEYLEKNIEFVSQYMDYSKNMALIARRMEKAIKC